MKKPLLFLASIALSYIGSFLLFLLGNIYMNFAHPDGLSYGKFLLREILFGVPDMVLFFSGYLLFGAVVLVSPYRKVTGALLLLTGVYYAIKLVSGPPSTASLYINLLTDGWAIVGGLIGIFGKSYDETNSPELANK